MMPWYAASSRFTSGGLVKSRVRYGVVQNHLETFLALCYNDWDDERISSYAERELRAYLECGIVAYGFARAPCEECGHDFLVAFSCKGRGIRPSCNSPHGAERSSPRRSRAAPAAGTPVGVVPAQAASYHLRRERVDKDDGKEMEQWDHGGGFSLDARVRIAANDRRGLERLLRDCARPAFAVERLQELDAYRLSYHLPKPGPDGRTAEFPVARLPRAGVSPGQKTVSRHFPPPALSPKRPISPCSTCSKVLTRLSERRDTYTQAVGFPILHSPWGKRYGNRSIHRDSA
jgi:hypothetical protein